MRIPVSDYLDEVLQACADDDGEVADYIPELAKADPDRFGIVIATVDGEVYSAGDADVEFSIQSISKPFTYALAIADQGLEGVLKHIDVEPSGDAFNEISLEPSTGRPRNPMINAGAIAAHAMVAGDDADTRTERIIELYSRLAGRQLSIDEGVFDSELDSADRNMAIAYMLRTVDRLDDAPPDVVRGYTRQCAVSVTATDLARMAAVLAANGVAPDGTEILDTAVTRHVLSVMATCGMYDAAGDWLTTVGIPAKSGVSGGLIGVLPGQVGIAVFSPRLDRHGNSSRGVRVFERLSRDMGLHLMEATETGRSAVRSAVEHDDDVHVHEVAGDLRFVEAERVLRELAAEPEGDDVVVIDLHRVHRINDVARRMLLEAIRRLHLDGHPVRLVDPDDVLPDPDSGDGYVPQVFDDAKAAIEG